MGITKHERKLDQQTSFKNVFIYSLQQVLFHLFLDRNQWWVWESNLVSFLSSISMWYIRKKTNVVNRRIKIWEMNLCHAFGYSQESSVLAAGLLSLEREGFFFSSSSIEIIKLYYPFTWHSFVFQLNPVLYLPLNVGSLGRAKKYIPLSIWLLNFIRESVNKRVGMFYGVP